jgi:hypothetical protein
MDTSSLTDKELQRHYEAMFELFASPGWAALMTTVDELIANTENIRRIEDAKTLFYRQGELANLEWLKGLQVMHEYSYRLLTENDELGAVEKPGVATVIE